MAILFHQLAWSGWEVVALSVLYLVVVFYALRSEVRDHQSTQPVTRFALACAMALASAYAVLVVYDGVLYNCEFAWWTLECWLWA